MDGQEMKKLIGKAKKGDTEAFGELYSYYAKDLYRFALYNLKNTYDAEDAVQNACIIAFTKIKDLKKDESFKSWFFKILYNECLKISGHKSRIFEVPKDDIVLKQENEIFLPDESGVMALFDKLSNEEKSVIILSVFDEYNSKEIAQILGMNPSTVRSSLSRLFKKLRIQLEGEMNV